VNRGPALTKGEVAYLVPALFFALFVPPLGALVAGLGAYDRHDNERRVALALLLGCTALGVALTLAPLLR